MNQWKNDLHGFDSCSNTDNFRDVIPYFHAFVSLRVLSFSFYFNGRLRVKYKQTCHPHVSYQVTCVSRHFSGIIEKKLNVF